MRYTYQIFAQNIGGERVKGTIPTKVAEWWLEKYPDLFQSYFMHEGKTHDEEDDWLSDYMAFVVDPVIFENDNLIRLGYDAETIKEILNE